MWVLGIDGKALPQVCQTPVTSISMQCYISLLLASDFGFHILSHYCVIIGITHPDNMEIYNHRNRGATHTHMTYVWNDSTPWYCLAVSLALQQFMIQCNKIWFNQYSLIWSVWDLSNGDRTFPCGPGGITHVYVWMGLSSTLLMHLLSFSQKARSQGVSGLVRPWPPRGGKKREDSYPQGYRDLSTDSGAPNVNNSSNSNDFDLETFWTSGSSF